MKPLARLSMFAGRLLPRSRSTRAAWGASLALCLVLLALPWVVRLDGKPHADWEQFLGRFHPLAVHFPVALVVLAPLLEIAGRFRPALREAAGLVLALAFASCLGALTLGFLLAYGGGSAGPGVTRHMWGGIALTIGVLLCLLARPGWASGNVPRMYPAMLTCILPVMLWAAHQGGSITHGPDYLTQYMPAGVKHWLGVGGQVPVSASFYAKHIHPILDANCVGCHGAGMTKGGLRLDSYELLMKGGQDGPVIVAGRPEKSVLLERVTLPADHKGVMPAEGKPPLRAEEIAWIRAWVLDGASATAVTVAGVSIQDKQEELPLTPVGDYSGLTGEIGQMDKSLGAKLRPVSSKPSDGLVLYTVDVAGSFGDAQLAQFEKFAPYIVEAELGRTAVTDASFDTLSKFAHLRALHMEETKVTGDGLGKLAPLSQLTYLNLSGTQLTQVAAARLSTMKNLRHVYLYNTPAQPIARSAP
jgi:uncharacterized membrane protein/mono/diheme cytochrome c family protein